MRRKQDYVSGEDIADRLGISRQALWKHIQELKDLGYDIVAVPHLGYKLQASPDRLFASEISPHLHTKIIGRKIHHFEELHSTMDAATQLAMQGAPEGTLVVAELQTKGRGRLGRVWFSPRYKGIYCSLILRTKISPGQSAILTLLSAVSVCEAIREATGMEAQIKWPNDILLHHKKVGGILTELNAEMDEIKFVVIGFGLNVNNDKKSLFSGATSLKECAHEHINRVELLVHLLEKLEQYYFLFQEKGASPIIEKWREYNITLGRRVKIYSHQAHWEGEAVDLDFDGALLLRKDSGFIQRVLSGDVVHCR